ELGATVGEWSGGSAQAARFRGALPVSYRLGVASELASNGWELSAVPVHLWDSGRLDRLRPRRSQVSQYAGNRFLWSAGVFLSLGSPDVAGLHMRMLAVTSTAPHAMQLRLVICCVGTSMPSRKSARGTPNQSLQPTSHSSLRSSCAAAELHR